jgi:Gas vesicle protein K
VSDRESAAGPRPLVEVSPGSAEAFHEELRHVARALPERINADPERVENGLARLALTLIELLRKILEHQAVRRMDGGTLSDEEVERLGLALLRLNERMQELKVIFNLTDEDLNIDLGPLGRLR